MNLARRILSKVIHVFLTRISRFHKERGTIFMFHDVGGDDSYSFNITVDEFKIFLDKISSRKVVPLSDMYKQEDGCFITFDDVPSSFYKNAYPILQEKKIPFTLFIATDLIGKDGFLSQAQIIELAKSPLCTVGSHGISHRMFYKKNKKEFLEELIESKLKLEQLINKEVEFFAFPYGSYFACGYRYKSLVLKYYKYGFSTINATLSSSKLFKKYFLPRINVSHEFINEFK